MMAAISAADEGARVVIAEKANTRRSGSGATGNDHFLCYIPEVHGEMGPIIKEAFESLSGKSQDKPLVVRHFKESFDRVKDWDSWGIPMKVDGKWEFTGHSYPGRPRIWLKYAGAEQKIILTREALKRGVTIINKIPVTDVITSAGEVIGAMGIDIGEKEPQMVVFRAKNVILTTGHTNRLYPAVTSGWIFNTARCPASTGTGRVAAYRAGARLVNIELPYTHSGPKYFARAGKATWIGVLVEAVAATGGNILPPVMGAVAFVMAEWLGVPYAHVAMAAIIPALLYYAIVFTSVHIQAVKTDLKAIPRAELPSTGRVMKEGWFYLLPLGGLIYFLLIKMVDPALAALYTLPILIGSSFLSRNKDHWMTPYKIWNSIVSGVKNWMLVGTITAAIGIMIGSLELSGLGLKFSSFIWSWAEGI
ncbi:FAD binding domain-containing protein [Desulfotomaculum arcticum]|uniref:FAD binding domain-containing protein n=1 Tax=Desulfotruncus arcticus DSM 17038 TaxID=1121424 RepID=A0A1I2P382_9FIRM|nr:FAD binding domain-containing protein [Desulfotomaculum arcticum] [Desulfotruncus arcticus DSM 17038]